MADQVTEYLAQEWDRLTIHLMVDRHTIEYHFQQLISAYTETHRAYHRPEHLQHLMRLLREAGALDTAVFFAAFYHDYVYEPGKSTNEMKSAKTAAEQLKSLGINSYVIERVEHLIVATQHHKLLESDYEGALFLDADMAILGASNNIYSNYVTSIKQEFSKVPRFLYNRGRKSFLKKLLNEDRIFATNWFYERFEANARKNIMWEIEQL